MTMKRIFAVFLLFFVFLQPDRADPPQQGRLTHDVMVGANHDIQLKTGQVVQVLKDSGTTAVVMVATGGASGIYQIDAKDVEITAAPASVPAPAGTNAATTAAQPARVPAGGGALAVPTSVAAPPPKPQPLATGARLIQFTGDTPVPAHPSKHVLYDFDLSQEHFWLDVPSGYDASTPWGLVVYDDPTPVMTYLPDGWEQVLNDDKLILIAPQNAGDDQNVPRRQGLCVIAALEMAKQYGIDPKRIYAAGFAGGARMAAELGFHQSDLFSASIQCSDSNYTKAVPRTAVTDDDVKQNPGSYLLIKADPGEIANAIKAVKVAIITGSGDYREHFLQDIFNGGYVADGFQAKLWDKRDLKHEPCSGSTLQEVLAFIEGTDSPLQ
jgi:hypothetical protein